MRSKTLPELNSSTNTLRACLKRAAEVARIFANMDSLQRQIEAAEKAIPILQNVVESYRMALLQGNADILTYYNARDELNHEANWSLST